VLESAEEKMGIPAILEANDLSSGKCNDKQLQLYLSLMYNDYKEKDLGMTKESLMKKVQELEEKLRILTEENVQLKLALENALQMNSQVQEKLSLASEEHSKVRRVKDDYTSKLRELEEKFDSQKVKWENELSELKAQKARLCDNNDTTTNQLQQEWEDTQNKRDLIREELRKTKEELLKEREELEAAQKKLLAKIERAKKTKQGLETIMKGSESSHAIAIPVLSTSVIQHANSMNDWIPILEADREYKHASVHVPSHESVLKKHYDEQIVVLAKLLDAQNKNFDGLLAERKSEATEIVSVAAGKRKKRVKTKEEIEGGYESLDDSEEEGEKAKVQSSPEKSKKSGSGKK